MNRYLRCLGAMMMMITVACNDPPASPGQALLNAEDRAILEKVKAKEQERTALSASPSKYILAGAWNAYDKGIVNTYTQATDIEFDNQSGFDVSDIEGSITYLNKAGQAMATVPFKAVGNLDAGKKSRLKVEATEISGGADRARIIVERVRVHG